MSDSFNTAKGQKAFAAELAYASAHHHYPGERKTEPVMQSRIEPNLNLKTPTPKQGVPAHIAIAALAKKAPAAAEAPKKASGRNEMSTLWHTYAKNHSSQPYTKQANEHNANIYHYVEKTYGKENADAMHKHAEAMRTNDVYGIRKKYNISETEDAYTQAKAKADANRAATRDASNRLDAFVSAHGGRASNGLTPDHIKAHPEHKKLHQDLDRAFQTERNYNGAFVKQYKKQIKDERANKYSKITEAADAPGASDNDLWSEHQRRYNANSAHSHVIAKAIEDEVTKRHGEKTSRDMVAHSVLFALGHNEPTRELIRSKNHITLTEASMARRELVPGTEMAMDRATFNNLKKKVGGDQARAINANRKKIISQASPDAKR